MSFSKMPGFSSWQKAIVVFVICCALPLVGCGDSPEKLERKEAEHLRLAEFYLKQGSSRASVIEIRNALQINPMSGKAHYIMAQVALSAYDGATATKEFELSEELGFVTADLPLDKIRALIRQNKVAEAREQLEAARPQFKGEPVFWVLLGDIEIAAGNIDEAKLAFEESQALAGDNGEALFGLARVALAAGDKFSVETYLDQALIADPGLAEAWIWKGRLALIAGEASDAEEAFFRARESDKADVLTPIKMMAVKGIVAAKVDQGKFADAEEYYQDFLEAYPQSSVAAVDEAASLVKAGDLAGAERVLEDILKNAPGDAESAILLGYINYAQGDLGNAERMLSTLMDSKNFSPKVVKLFAMTQLRQDRPASAVEVLKKVIKNGTNDAGIYSLYGLSAYLTGDKQNGKKALEKAIEIAPDNSEIRQFLARVYLSEGLSQQGVEQISRAITLSPLENGPRAQLVSALLDSGQAKAAGEALNDWLQITSDDADRQFDVMTSIMTISAAAGNVNWGESQLKERFASSEFAISSRLALAQYYLQAGRFEESANLSAFVLERDPQNVKALVIGGSTDVAAERFAAARKKFLTITEVDSDAPEGYHLMSRLELANQNSVLAKEWAEKAIGADADFVPALTTLVLAESDLEDFDKALEYARRIQLLNPSAVTGIELVGDVLSKQKQFDDAVQAYESAFQRRQSSRIVLKLFRSMKATGDRESAVEQLRGWVDANPKDLMPKLELASEYLQAGEYDLSIEYFESLQNETKDNPLVLNNLAWLYGETGDDRALVLARRAHELAPDNPAIMDTLGWLLLKDGQIGAAITLLEKAAAVAPESEEIGEHLAQAREQARNQ